MQKFLAILFIVNFLNLFGNSDIDDLPFIVDNSRISDLKQHKNCAKRHCRECRDFRRENTDFISCNTCNNNNVIAKLPEQNPCSCNACSKDECKFCNPQKTIFIPRSQGANTARELVGWQDFINRFTPGFNYFTYAGALEFTHSFRPERIARLLFGSQILNFTGSNHEESILDIINRSDCEILADNFGLSTQFQEELCIEPTIKNIIFDNQFFIGLDAFYPGSFIRIHAPIVHTKWSLHPKKINSEIEANCPEFAQCYMSKNKAHATCDLETALSGDFLFGDMQTPWRAGKFSFCDLKKTGLADIDFIIGQNIMQDMYSHFGLWLQFVLPTGNKPDARFVFEPIVGNAKHFEFGFGITGHLDLWNYGPDCSLTAFLEGNVTHLFKNCQIRSFNLCNNKRLNRYSLLKEFNIVNNEPEYNGNLINAINFTTRQIESTVPVKGELSAMLVLRLNCWSGTLGYNFYGNSEEDICLINSKSQQKDNLAFALKNLSGVCQNNNPKFLTLDDIDLNSGRAAATATHKVFAHINYTLGDLSSPYMPFLGIGGEFEVEALACNQQTSLNQWGVWFKAGAAF